MYCGVYLPWFVSVLWCASFLRLFAVVCFGNVVAVVCLCIMGSLFAVVCFFQGGVSAYHGLLVLRDFFVCRDVCMHCGLFVCRGVVLCFVVCLDDTICCNMVGCLVIMVGLLWFVVSCRGCVCRGLFVYGV